MGKYRDRLDVIADVLKHLPYQIKAGLIPNLLVIYAKSQYIRKRQIDIQNLLIARAVRKGSSTLEKGSEQRVVQVIERETSFGNCLLNGKEKEELGD